MNFFRGESLLLVGDVESMCMSGTRLKSPHIITWPFWMGLAERMTLRMNFNWWEFGAYRFIIEYVTLLMLQIKIIKRPSGSDVTFSSWKSTEFLTAIMTPLALVECVAWKIWGKWWFLQREEFDASKWVSWTHRMSLWRAEAVFHSECRLAGWLSPLAFIESMLIGILWMFCWWVDCITLTVRRWVRCLKIPGSCTWRQEDGRSLSGSEVPKRLQIEQYVRYNKQKKK